MRVIDVDSHFMEPLDWLEKTDPGLAAELPPSNFAERVARGVVGDLLDKIPPAERPKNLLELLAPQGRRSAEALMAAWKGDKSEMTLESPTTGYEAEARLKLNDEHGIDVQFVNPTMGTGPYVSAIRMGRRDLGLRAFKAFNSWAAQTFAGHTDRLVPVTLVDLIDVDWAVGEMTRMRKAGSRVVQIKPDPVSETKSLTHPDFERVWSAAEDLGMAVVFHIASGRAELKHGWYFNGGAHGHYAVLQLINGQMVPQIALAAMIIDGVFERHPKLAVIVEELGIGWVPNFIEMVDSVTVGPYGTQFGMGKEDYKLPLKPSEYIRRHVRFTPLVTTDALSPTMELIPPELLVFSSDFPHHEGRANAVELFAPQLKSRSEAERAQFYGGSIGALMGI